MMPKTISKSHSPHVL